MGKKQKQPYIYLAHQRLREMVDVDILVESKLNILLLNSPLFITNTESDRYTESHNAIVQRNILNNPPPHQPHSKGLKRGAPWTNLDLALTRRPKNITNTGCTRLSKSHLYAEGFIFSFKIMKDCLSVSITGSQHK